MINERRTRADTLKYKEKAKVSLKVANYLGDYSYYLIDDSINIQITSQS